MLGGGAWCICSYYAPHAGLPQETRVSFWRDFVAVAQRVQNPVSVPMVIAGVATQCEHPHFNLSRSRSCDVPIIPFLRFGHGLLADWTVRAIQRDRATHISGAGLDCIFISSGHVVRPCGARWVAVLDRLRCVLSSVGGRGP